MAYSASMVTAPIASATKENQLDALMHSAEINLSEEDVVLLNDAGK